MNVDQSGCVENWTGAQGFWNVVRGYAKFTADGKLLLGFTNNAPIFERAELDAQLLKLYAASKVDTPVAYCANRRNESQGFLWHAHEKDRAYAEAAAFGDDYVCTPLIL